MVTTAQAALAIFNRTLQLVDIATGLKKVTDTLGSTGPITATVRISRENLLGCFEITLN